MQIENELKKLNQLDRIEFRQRHDMINRAYNSNLMVLTFIIATFFILAIFIIDWVIFIMSGDPLIFYNMLNMICVGLLIIVVGWFCDLLFMVFATNKKRKLFFEYFEIKNKKKK